MESSESGTCISVSVKSERSEAIIEEKVRPGKAAASSVFGPATSSEHIKAARFVGLLAEGATTKPPVAVSSAPAPFRDGCRAASDTSLRCSRPYSHTRLGSVARMPKEPRLCRHGPAADAS
jgi:hypothetical protein